MMRCLVGVSLVLAAPWPPAREIPKEELPKTYCEFERTVIQPYEPVILRGLLGPDIIAASKATNMKKRMSRERVNVDVSSVQHATGGGLKEVEMRRSMTWDQFLSRELEEDHKLADLNYMIVEGDTPPGLLEPLLKSLPSYMREHLDLRRNKIFASDRFTEAITGLHTDKHDNLYLVGAGTKRMLVVPHEDSHLVYPDRSRPRYSAALVAQFPAWDLNKSALEELWRRPAPEQFPDWGKARIQEVEAKAGDAVFIPAGTWHSGLNGDEWSIAYTQWFSSPNPFLSFLVEYVQQEVAAQARVPDPGKLRGTAGGGAKGELGHWLPANFSGVPGFRRMSGGGGSIRPIGEGPKPPRPMKDTVDELNRAKERIMKNTEPQDCIKLEAGGLPPESELPPSPLRDLFSAAEPDGTALWEKLAALVDGLVANGNNEAREKILSLVKSREAVGDEKFKESIRQWPVERRDRFKHLKSHLPWDANLPEGQLFLQTYEGAFPGCGEHCAEAWSRVQRALRQSVTCTDAPKPCPPRRDVPDEDISGGRVQRAGRGGQFAPRGGRGAHGTAYAQGRAGRGRGRGRRGGAFAPRGSGRPGQAYERKRAQPEHNMMRGGRGRARGRMGGGRGRGGNKARTDL